MKKLPKIVRIIKIEPFKLTLRWNTRELRICDFTPLFEIWEKEGDSKMAVLRDFAIFQQVSLSQDRTLCWPNITIPFTFKGQIQTSPLELDVLELYRLSTPINKMNGLKIGAMLRNARENAGLSQADVALKSGTTRNYISRIENDNSDIQLETLQKIVELGIGGEMILQIKSPKSKKKGRLTAAE